MRTPRIYCLNELPRRTSVLALVLVYVTSLAAPHFRRAGSVPAWVTSNLGMCALVACLQPKILPLEEFFQHPGRPFPQPLPCGYTRRSY